MFQVIISQEQNNSFFLACKATNSLRAKCEHLPKSRNQSSSAKVLSRDLRQVNHDFGTSKKMKKKQKHGCVLSSMRGLGYPSILVQKLSSKFLGDEKLTYEASRVFQLHKLNPHCLQYIKKRTGF